MPFDARSDAFGHYRRILPPEALDAYCFAANKAERQGGDQKACNAAGWDAIEKQWHRPDRKRPYVRKPVDVRAAVQRSLAPRRHDDDDNGAPAMKDGKSAIAKQSTQKLLVRTFKVGDDEQRMVYGWASVISEDGKPYVDSQGDMIKAETLERAVTDFMIDVRLGLEMHERDAAGRIDPSIQKALVVHSFPMTADIMKALGIVCKYEGWPVGVKVLDDAVWESVKSGDLPAFSIGGWSTFEEHAAT